MGTLYARLFKELSKMQARRPVEQSALKRYYDEEAIVMTYETNAIEGSSITLDETYLLINDGITIAGKSFIEQSETLGTSAGFWFLYEAVKKEKKELDEKFIKTLDGYIRFNYPTPASYRNYPVRLTNSMVILPNPQKVPELMEKYVETYNNDFYQPMPIKSAKDTELFFLKLAEKHYDFERIHPFEDGNGRTGRLMLNFEALKHGLPPLQLPKEARVKYYDSFEYIDKNNDDNNRFHPMADLFAEQSLKSALYWNERFKVHNLDQENEM